MIKWRHFGKLRVRYDGRAAITNRGPRDWVVFRIKTAEPFFVGVGNATSEARARKIAACKIPEGRK